MLIYKTRGPVGRVSAGDRTLQREVGRERVTEQKDLGAMYYFGSLIPCQSPFLALRRKNELHIRIPAGFLEAGWDNISGEINLDFMAFGSQ
jgi:hypothetical protein